MRISLAQVREPFATLQKPQTQVKQRFADLQKPQTRERERFADLQKAITITLPGPKKGIERIDHFSYVVHELHGKLTLTSASISELKNNAPTDQQFYIPFTSKVLD